MKDVEIFFFIQMKDVELELVCWLKINNQFDVGVSYCMTMVMGEVSWHNNLPYYYDGNLNVT